MKKQRCSGFRRLIVATQGAGSACTAISRAFVVVSATTRRTIARPKGDRLLSGSCRSAATPSHPSPLAGEGEGGGQTSLSAPGRRHPFASGDIGKNASFPGQLLFVGYWNTMPREVQLRPWRNGF